MTMGLSMALHEESVMDRALRRLRQPRPRRSTTSPPAPTSSDIDARWIDEDDPHLNPMGSKGIGEIGIVGTAAPIANAVYHATGHPRPRPADPARPRARLDAGGVEHDLDVVAHLQRAHEPAVRLRAPAVWTTGTVAADAVAVARQIELDLLRSAPRSRGRPLDRPALDALGGGTGSPARRGCPSRSSSDRARSLSVSGLTPRWPSRTASERGSAVSSSAPPSSLAAHS